MDKHCFLSGAGTAFKFVPQVTVTWEPALLAGRFEISLLQQRKNENSEKFSRNVSLQALA
jgi:hypothetical protein